MALLTVPEGQPLGGLAGCAEQGQGAARRGVGDVLSREAGLEEYSKAACESALSRTLLLWETGVQDHWEILGNSANAAQILCYLRGEGAAVFIHQLLASPT